MRKMKLTAKQYVEDMKKPEHKNVIFRYPNVGDPVVLPIEEFLEEYGDREVSINGDFIDENGYLMNAFIKRTSS